MKKIISIMLCIMLSVSMMTACGSKESDNEKKMLVLRQNRMYLHMI